jgi:Uma2 family endonuclease
MIGLDVSLVSQEGKAMSINSYRKYMTVEEYLEFDRNAEFKHEYYDGEVVAMSGCRSSHNRLTMDMARFLEDHIGFNGPCVVYVADMRVYVTQTNYFYPDVIVSCNSDDHQDTNDILRSPRLVVEVLSPSTASRDRKKKLPRYQQCPTIQECVFINYRVRRVEVYRRPAEEGAPWTYHIFEAGQQGELTGLNLLISIDELYARTSIPVLIKEEEEEYLAG